MSIEKATAHLEKYGFADRIQILSDSTATVSLAAQALGCKDEEIAKSITFYGNDDKCILILASGTSKIDNAKFKAEFGIKAKMLSFDDVEAKIGHAVGGVCPFGVNEGVLVYLDSSLEKFDTVYPAAGSHNACLKLSLDELKQCSEYIKVVDVCK